MMIKRYSQNKSSKRVTVNKSSKRVV